MTKLNKDSEINGRARSLIDSQLGARGRFTVLEEMSGISVSQWKNFYYGKQFLNEQMLDFLVNKYPHDEIWLLTGKQAPKQDEFPFLAPIPKKSDCESVGTRLNWVIREWASPKGNTLFEYLYQASSRGGTSKKIPAADWAQVVLGLAEPTIEMITTVCENRPHFTQWVLLGHASNFQVDPTSEVSVTSWGTRQQAEWSELEMSFRTQKQHGNKKS